MKQHTLVLIILIFIATASSVGVLASEGYFSKKDNNKILASEEKTTSKPIVLAKANTSVQKPTITKPSTTVKKAPVKKVVPKKKVVAPKKSKLNLAPPVFTPATAPYSAKKR